VKLIGVGKSQHMSTLGNWTNGNDASVCADQSGFAGYATWNDWGASQRDLYVLDHEGNEVFHENITSSTNWGNSSSSNWQELRNFIEELISQIPADCNPDLACGEAITCCDGLLYPTTCCSENCDESIGECECTEGEVNNDNPCNPMECWEGQWIEIIIDCAEQMGVPCEGGAYVPPEEGECCSECVLFASGDINGDGVLNVLDIVALVNLVLSGNSYNEVADMNSDGILNVLDVVLLVGIVLG